MSTPIALVTGASRGIGKAVALELARSGMEVLINYRSNTAEAETTRDAILAMGGKASLLPFDVADAAAVTAAIEQWQTSRPGEYISVLVNNAGIRHDNLMMWLSADEWSSVVNTNLNAFYLVTRMVLKDMIHKKYGRIINITSLSGIKGMAGQTNYAASKGGLIAATKSLALEVARKNITVNAVAPGFIKTDMTADINEEELKKLVPMHRFGDADEVASIVGFLAGPRASYITGEVISVNGGLYT